MTPEQTWAIYYAGVCAMQFHPANHATHADLEVAAVTDRCAEIADEMLRHHNYRWKHATAYESDGINEPSVHHNGGTPRSD